MKKSLLLFILLTMSHVGYSQLSVGVAGGFTRNTLDTDPGYYERTYSPMNGYSIAIPIQYSFKDWFALRTELGYMTKGYSWDRDYINDDYFNDDGSFLQLNEYQEYRNGYLSIPVMANFSYGGERLRGFVNVGAWVGAWLNGEISGEVTGIYNNELYSIDNKYEFDSRKDNRFDAGLLCGIGAEYKICSQIGIFAEGRYMYGLTDMQKNYQESYHHYNSTILVQLGVTYIFNLK